MERFRINIELLIKTTITGGFSLLFFYLWFSGKALNFIHPRMLVFIQVTAIVLMVMTVFQVRLICVSQEHHSSNWRKLTYILFLSPIILGFVVASRSLDTFFAEKKGISLEKKVLSGPNRKSNQNPAAEFFERKQVTGREKIVIQDETYSREWYAIFTGVPRYLGKELEVTGFVYKNADLVSGDFILARYLISCCAADAMVVGFICRYPGVEVTENTWFKATGIIEAGIFNKNEVPVIRLTHLEPIAEPINQYVY